MPWLKKNPLFALLLVACAAAVGVEAWQIWTMRQRALRAAVQLDAKRQERDWLAHRSPALTEENTVAIAADVAALAQKITDLRATLAGRGPWLPAPPAISRDAFFALGKFNQHLKSLAVAQQVALANDERFGFASYSHVGPESELVAPVHRQRVVLQHLIELLFEARPRSLVNVQRERPLPEALRVALRTPVTPGQPAPAAPRTAGLAADFFEPDVRLRLQAPGLVEGELYRLEFVGQTQTLRAFLNGITQSALPLIVRAVEVEPAVGDPAVPAAAGALADAAAAEKPSSTVPVVGQNFSKFAVVVECVDVLPAAAAPAT